jgi:hypothetical protein
MSQSAHYSTVVIVPKLYDKCLTLVGSRVRIRYSNGRIIEAFLKKVIDYNHIYINCEMDGLIHLPITHIEGIIDC